MQAGQEHASAARDRVGHHGPLGELQRQGRVDHLRRPPARMSPTPHEERQHLLTFAVETSRT
jgi:hypothetical protein